MTARVRSSIMLLLLMSLVAVVPHLSAQTVVFGDLKTNGSTSAVQYGPGDGVFVFDVSGVPAAADPGILFVKIANDPAASGDGADLMPEFEAILERRASAGAAWAPAAGDAQQLLTTQITSLASNYLSIQLTPDPQATSTGFADEKIYTLQLIFSLGGWAAQQGGGAQERLRIGVKNHAPSDRTYFGAAGSTQQEASVGHLRVLPGNSIAFGEVLIGFVNLADAPSQSIVFNNVGTGSLTITSFGAATDGRFAAPSVATPFVQPPFPTTPLTVPMQFWPRTSNTPTPGPVTATMTLGLQGQPSASIELKATAVKLELTLLLDVSGSMSWKPDGGTANSVEETRLYLAKQAGAQVQELVSALEGEAVRASIYRFPGTPGSCPPPDAAQHVGFNLLSNAGQVLAFNQAWGEGTGKLDAVWRGTPMAQGLKLAYGMPGSAFGVGRWTNGPYVRRALLLLSDGAHNCDSPAPRGSLLDWTTFFQTVTSPSDSIRVYTIAFGDATASNVDREILSNLASAAGGGMYEVTDQDDLLQLQKQFRRALIEWRSWAPVTDPRGTLSYGQGPKTYDVCIDPDIDRMSFVVDWDRPAQNAIQFSLSGPIGPVSTASPDVRYHSGATHAMYTIKGAMARGNAGSDRWTLTLTPGPGLSAGQSTNFNYAVVGKSRVRATSSLAPVVATTDTALPIQIALTGAPLQSTGPVEVSLSYDLPAESRGAYLSSMDGFDPQWIVRRTHPTVTARAVVRPDSSERTAPDVILGEPATTVQRKEYALTYFQKRPFLNRRRTGTVELRRTADGSYVGMLPAMRYDGSARFSIIISAGALGSNCFRRELQLERFVNVGLTLATIQEGIRLVKVAESPFFSDSLRKRLVAEPPQDFERRSFVFMPRDVNGNPWGPGHADDIQLTFNNAERFSETIDRMNGEYEVVLQMRRGARPTVAIAAAGVTTPPLDVTGRKHMPWWIIAVLVVLLLIVALLRRMRHQTP